MAFADLTAEDAFVRGLPPGQPNTAAFMRLINSDAVDITIDRVTTDGAELAEFHAHRHHKGMMSMEKVDSITVPAGGEFILAPGEHHLMLINLSRPLADGDKVTVRMFSGDVQRLSTELMVRSVLNE
jgi:copper(I)-binding protein